MKIKRPSKRMATLAALGTSVAAAMGYFGGPALRSFVRRNRTEKQQHADGSNTESSNES